MPLLIVALLPKLVLPTPLKPDKVIVPLAALKFTALFVVFEFATVESDKPVPLIVATPVALTLNAADGL